jgi:hypothetical protein
MQGFSDTHSAVSMVLRRKSAARISTLKGELNHLFTMYPEIPA